MPGPQPKTGLQPLNYKKPAEPGPYLAATSDLVTRHCWGIAQVTLPILEPRLSAEVG